MKIEGFAQMLEAIQRERGIPKEALVEAISAAMLSACKKRFTTTDNLEAKIADDGDAKVFSKRKVVSRLTDEDLEIRLRDAKKLDPKAKVGDEVLIDVTPHDFGRLAAQTAKQVVIQRIREAEKETAFSEYTSKAGSLINGIVQKKEKTGYLVNLGKIETMLPLSEAIPGEYYRPKDYIKLFVVETKKTPRGPLVVVSRTHPGLVKKLFELEVPEFSTGILEIKGLAREAGRRTKIAVHSNDKNISAVGTCVGHMGTRIQNIVKELGNERIDVIEWNEDVRGFISNSLSPAKVASVKLDEAEHKATVLVPEAQLSLAIGKEGQNVRLAAKLTGWKIDIMSSEEAAKVAKEKEEGKGNEAVASGEEKTKVHELAKELGIPSKEIVEKLNALGYEIKGATSNVTPEAKEKLIEKLAKNDETDEKVEEGPKKEEAAPEEKKEEA